MHLSRARGIDRPLNLLLRDDLKGALDRLTQGTVDVALLDLELPDSRGLETLRRAVETAPNVPIVVLAGVNDERLGAKAVQLGAQDYLVKGFIDEVLLARSIRFSIDRHKMRMALAAAGRRIRKSHDRLQRSEARLRGLVDHLAEGVALLDERGQVLLANKAAKEALGLLGEGAEDRVERLGGRPMSDLLVETASTGWSELTADGEPERVFEVALRMLETPRPRGPRPTSTGTPPMRSLVIRDVTSVRERQRHVERHERLAALGQVAAGLAHDLGNELQCLTGDAEILAREAALEGELASRVRRLREHGERAAEITRRLLDFGSGARAPRRPVDLTALLVEWTDDLRQQLPEGIVVELASPLPDVSVRGDRTQLFEVLGNLASNAREAMPDGGELTCELEVLEVGPGDAAPLPGMQPGPWTVLRIGDTGPGIPADVRERVFEPYYTTRTAEGGTGLGLAQVYGLVRGHGGYVDVTSRPGQGAAFTIYLPLDRTPPRPEPTPSHEDDLPRGHGERILVVDDEADVRELLVVSLQHLGYEALPAPDARRALRLFEEHDDGIAAVLTDVTMPGMGGEELARRLLQLRPDARVALLTAHDLQHRAKHLERLGLAGWMRKPVDQETLAQRVRELVAGG